MQRLAAVLCLFLPLALFACKPDKKGDDGPPSRSEDAHGETSDATLAIVTRVARAGTSQLTTLAELRTILATNCATCHALGTALDLTEATLAAMPQDERARTFARVRERTVDAWGLPNGGAEASDPARRMPAAAPLPAEALATLQRFYDDGYLAQAPPAADNPLFNRATAVRLAVTVADEGGTVLGEHTAAGPANASHTIALPGLPTPAALGIRIVAQGENGTQVAEATLTLATPAADPVLAEIRLDEARLLAAFVDDGAPVPPTGANAVEVRSVSQTGARVEWRAATDDVSAAKALAYALFIAPATPALTDVAAIEAGARRHLDYKPGALAATAEGLTAGTAYAAHVVVRDAAGRKSAYPARRFTTEAAEPELSPVCKNACAQSDTDPRYEAICYSCKCKQALGALPTPAEVACSVATEIQVFRLEPTPGTGVLRRQKVTTEVADCINPALLGAVSSDAACLPGSRLGQLTKGGSHFKWICRRKAWHPGWADPLTDAKYEDIGIIGINPKTGATCFWDDGDDSPDGNNMPDIDLTSGELAKADTFLTTWYNTQGDGCTGCHDSDPFLYTGYLESVGWTTDRDVVFGRYRQVRPNGPPTSVGTGVKHLVSSDAAACTSCHRIADLAACGLSKDSMGIKMWGRPYQTGADGEGAANYPHAYWMAPHWSPNYPTTFGQWTATFKKARDHIVKCCDNAAAAGCEWAPLP